MATIAQVLKLRRKLQDYYDKRTNLPLVQGSHAFSDDELLDIIDDASAEVSGGIAAENLTAEYESWMMIVARADAILQIAQDEARRVKWQMNNEIVDPTNIAENLIKVAESLQKRYEGIKDRQLKREIEGLKGSATGGTTGGVMNFNDTVRPNSSRNFNNQTVRRNSSRDHRY